MNTYFIVWGDYDAPCQVEAFTGIDLEKSFVARLSELKRREALDTNGAYVQMVIQGRELEIEPVEVETVWRVKGRS